MSALAAMLVVGVQASVVRGATLPWSNVGPGGAAFGAGGGHQLGATLGQSGAGESATEGVAAVAGFWAIMRVGGGVPTPTGAATATRTPSPTASGGPSATATRTATSTPTGFPPSTATATVTSTATSAPSPTPTPSAPTATATPTFTPRPGCGGDCNHDGEVRVDELVRLVNIALGLLTANDCQAGDRNGDGRVTIDEILLAVTHALFGCTAGPLEGEPP